MVAHVTHELVSSSELAKKFGVYLAKLSSNTVDKLAILKNNKVEAEQILSSIKAGLNDFKLGNTKPISTLWNELDN